MKINAQNLEDGIYKINENEWISVFFGLCTQHWEGKRGSYDCHSSFEIDMNQAIEIVKNTPNIIHKSLFGTI